MRLVLSAIGAALLLALIVVPVCYFVGYVYSVWCHIPIEGLSALVFMFETMALTFLIAVLYAIACTSILHCRTALTALSRFAVVFGIGLFVLIITVGILFPCLPEPGFVGGYLFKKFLSSP